jgi:hypothetical protein
MLSSSAFALGSASAIVDRNFEYQAHARVRQVDALDQGFQDNTNCRSDD